MKQILLTTIAALVLVGCGESQQSAPQAEPVEPIAEAAKPEPPTAISIHDAVEKGNVEAIKQHLAAGTDVNARDSIGETPLFYAAVDGHKEIAELLIAEGADVNAKDDKIVGYPLHFAAAFGHKEIAEMLIANGADVNAKIEITELFIALGAGVNAKDVDGETPLDWAIRGSTKAMPESAHPRHHPEIATLLRKHGGKTGEELKAEPK